MQISPALVRASALALSGVLLAPALAFGADGETTPLHLQGKADAEAPQVGASGGGIVRMIVGLAIVLAVIYGLTWVLRQLKASKQSSAAGSGLEALATLPLGTNRSLHLVRAGDEVVLVGAGEHGVTPIRTYTDAEARALGLLDDDGPPGEDGDVFGGGGARRGGLLAELRRRTVIK